MCLVHVAYQQFETVLIFSFVTYSSGKPSPFFEPSIFMRPGRHLFPVFQKSFMFDCSSHNSQTSTPTFSFLPHGWCKWKGMIYTYMCYYSTGRDLPQKLAWLHYKFLALHMYILCANMLAICILSVKLLVGLVTELHLHLVVMYFKHQMTYPNLSH